MIPPPGSEDGGKIDAIDLKSALEERYLAYALSTIMGRALPDVRDGLKPVQRRILYVMRQLRLNPGQTYRKCAKIVGDVMGNFHPHGDQAIYDALVRLAQDFAVRYPLVDGQGNFGNIDGDNAAAYRYTEARMTEVATLLLEGIEEDAVDFRPNYNDEDEEPVVLPGAFPNLLANGSSGIAVGMATSIPPHNAAELCDAALHLIDNRNADSADLMQFVPGPDFPTGGVIVDDAASIAEAYRTGRGGFRVRAKWEKEDGGRGTWRIVITEIPWQVQKSRLIEKAADLLFNRKLPLVEDIRDESAEDVRIVIEPKSRTVDPELLMESLFKLTELESRISLNMNVLSKGKVPKVLSLAGVLREWLDHRRDVLLRRSRHRLAQIDRRLEILDGLLIAYLNIDEVIRIIRFEDEPKQKLIETFSLTEIQVEAILNMRLRNLAKLEEMELRKEHEALSQERAQIVGLLDSEIMQWKVLAADIREIRKQYGPDTALGKRRTHFASAPDRNVADIQQAMIEREPVTIVLSEKGWLRAMRGHLADLSTLTFKEGDKLRTAFHAETTDKILIFATNGKFYTLAADKLPGGRGAGEPVRVMLEMENDADIVAAFRHDPSRKLLLVSNIGNGFVAPEAEMAANTRKGKQAMNVATPVEAAFCVPIAAGDDHVAIIGDNRKLLCFPLAQVPEMGRGKGVRLQKYKDGGVKDIKTFAVATGLTWADTAGRIYTKSKQEAEEFFADRASAGRIAPKGFPRTGRFSG